MHFFRKITHSIGFLPIAVSAARTMPKAHISRFKTISLSSAFDGISFKIKLSWRFGAT